MYLEAKPPKLLQCHGQHSYPFVRTAVDWGGNTLDFVENDAGGLVDAEEAHSGSDKRHYDHDLVVGHGEEEDIVIGDAL